MDDFKSADETDGKTITDWKRDEVAEKEVYISSKLSNAKANPTGILADPEDVYDSVYVRVKLTQTLIVGGEAVPQASPTNISSNQYPTYVQWTKTGTIKTIDEWYNAGSLLGEYWVQDSDGWLYWAQPLEFGQETTHLLDTVKLLVAPVGGLDYTVNVQLEAVSSNLENTAVIADYEGGFDDWSIADTAKIMPLFKNDYSYSIGHETLIMNATSTQQLTLSMTPNNKLMPTTTWSSSDTAIASVDSATGIVTEVAAGIATISAQ